MGRIFWPNSASSGNEKEKPCYSPKWFKFCRIGSTIRRLQSMLTGSYAAALLCEEKARLGRQREKGRSILCSFGWNGQTRIAIGGLG